MATTLTERLQEMDRQALIKEASTLIDEEVRRKSGLSGMALKGGYKVINKIKPGMIEDAVDHLLDDFTDALNPVYQAYQEQDEVETFEEYIKKHDRRAANDLLSITDGRAERSDNKVLKSTYSKLRGQAEKHVVEALPGVGRMIDKHASKKE
ncbi:MAG: DUF6918 family protein [Bradymonadaceae bacterium]